MTSPCLPCLLSFPQFPLPPALLPLLTGDLLLRPSETLAFRCPVLHLLLLVVLFPATGAGVLVATAAVQPMC